MPTAQVQLRVRAGATLALDLAITDQLGAPLDFTSKSLRFEIAPQPGAQPAVAFDAAPHVVLVNPGGAKLRVPPEATRLLTGWGGRYYLSVLLVSADGVAAILAGTLLVAGELVTPPPPPPPVP